MISLVWNNAEGQPVIVTPNSRLLLALLGVLSLGVFVLVGLILALVGAVGYVVWQVLGLVTAVLASSFLVQLLVPTLFAFVLGVLIWFCIRYLWRSLIAQSGKAATI